jgi:hypothetical protein
VVDLEDVRMSDESARVHVVFRKQVSDGNYGSESAEVWLDVFEADDDAAIAVRLETARRLVHAELAKSLAWRVRDAVTPSEQDVEEVPL